MAESAVLDSQAPIAEAAPETIPMGVETDGAVAVGGAELEGDYQEPVEEIPEDDPRIARHKAEWERRREQALNDQRQSLVREREQAMQRARDEARWNYEREQASAQGRQQRVAAMKGVLEKALEADDPEQALSQEWERLEAQLNAGTTRGAFESTLRVGNEFFKARYGGFQMPQEWIPRYEQALMRGELDVASGMQLEAARVLAYREGYVAAQQAAQQAAGTEQQTDERAERLRAERAAATAPGTAPARPTQVARQMPKPLSAYPVGSPEFRAAYKQKHGIEPPF